MFRHCVRQVGMFTVTRAAPSANGPTQRPLRHRPCAAKEFVSNANIKFQTRHGRESMVAMASPGLTALLPFFFLAPFAVFFGPLGCLPLIFAAPFLFAFWALSAALTLATVIVTSVIALSEFQDCRSVYKPCKVPNFLNCISADMGGATAVAYFVLPRALGKSPSEMRSEFEATINKSFGQGPVIDVKKNPSVDDVYDDLDKDLDDFDKTLRDRRRR